MTIERALKISNTLKILVIGTAVILCMWTIYNIGKERGQQTFNMEIFKPDTTGVKIIMLSADPYDVDVAVIITQNKRKAAELLRWYSFDNSIVPETLNARAITFWPSETTNWGIPCIWLPEIPNTPEEYGIVSHEMTHLTHLIMDFVGVVYSDEAEEAFAYENGYLMKQFYLGCLK